jgi:hypothetical protein
VDVRLVRLSHSFVFCPHVCCLYYLRNVLLCLTNNFYGPHTLLKFVWDVIVPFIFKKGTILHNEFLSSTVVCPHSTFLSEGCGNLGIETGVHLVRKENSVQWRSLVGRDKVSYKCVKMEEGMEGLCPPRGGGGGTKCRTSVWRLRKGKEA